MGNPATGPRFRLAPGVVLRGGARPPLPAVPPGAQAPAPADDEPSTEDQAPDERAGDQRGEDQQAVDERGEDQQAVDERGEDQQAVDENAGRGASPAARAFRNSRWDRAALAVTIDPAWLLAPLYARDCAGLPLPDGGPGHLDPPLPGMPVTDIPVTDMSVTDMPFLGAGITAEDWLAWWTAALAYRPGTPAPLPEDLIGGSAALQRWWAELAGPFRDWLAGRTARGSDAEAPDAAVKDATARDIERAALDGFEARNGRAPGRWTVRILQIPVTGVYLRAPEPRRIVVSAGLRCDRAAYASALAAELPRHF